MSNRLDYLSKKYRGVDINVYPDEMAECPMENWDGLYPLCTESSYYKDYSDGDILEYLLDFLSYNQILYHQNKLCVFAYDMTSNEVFENNENSDDKVNLILDRLREKFVDEGIEAMQEFCKMFKIKHLCEYSRGYSQGDCAKVFICWTPKFEKITGVSYKEVSIDSMQGTFDVFSAWAWGDVFYVQIESEVEHKDLSELSVGSFYGEKELNGYIDNEVIPAIDKAFINDKAEYYKKAKELIKNRVPLNIRQKELAKLKYNLLKF